MISTRGGTIDIFACLRPLVFSVVLMNYAFIFSFVNHVFEVWPDKLTQVMSQSIKQKVLTNDVHQEMNYHSGAQTTKEDDGWVSKSIMKFLVNALILLNDTIKFLLGILQKLSLAPLFAFGPIVISMEIFPGFGGSIRGWIGQVISLSLWMPLINLSQAISSSIGDILINKNISVSNDAVSLLYIVVTTALNVIVYLKIPALAGSLFGNGSGTGDAIAAGAIGSSWVLVKSAGMKGAAAVGEGAKALVSSIIKMSKKNKKNDFVK